MIILMTEVATTIVALLTFTLVEISSATTATSTIVMVRVLMVTRYPGLVLSTTTVVGLLGSVGFQCGADGWLSMGCLCWITWVFRTSHFSFNSIDNLVKANARNI